VLFFAETYNYFSFNELSLVLWLSIPCNSHQTGLGSTPKQVPFQSRFTGGMEYAPCYRMMTVLIKWENIEVVVTCLMVLLSQAEKKHTEKLPLVSLQPQNGQNLDPSTLTTSNSTTILKNTEGKNQFKL
jgi:hypothetical protein